MSGNPLLSLPKPSSTVAEDSDDVAPEEVKAIGSQVQRDLENDNRPAINRHFEDLLDELSSSASRASDTGLPSREEQQSAESMLREFCRAVERGVSEAVQGQGLTVRHVTAQEDCIAIVCEDRLGNGWQASCPFSQLERDLERHGHGPSFVAEQVGRAVKVILQARAGWWMRSARA